MQVRKMHTGDIENMEYICLATAAPALRTDKKREQATLEMYNRYYTRETPEHCFVLADDENKAVGYIICAPNPEKYKRGFIKHEVKAIRKLNPLWGVAAYASAFVNRKYEKQYPAHMHIDILPAYQGQGWGTEMVRALFAQLKEEKVRGLMLGVAADNTRAIAFYKKQGFKVLGGSVTMGVAF